MKLVCHIGTPKTASTYLQNTCAANSEWLARRGVRYPGMLAPDSNHITLFYAAAGQLHDFARDYGLQDAAAVTAFRARLSDHIADVVETAAPGIDTVLMSSENLTGNLIRPGEIARLRDLLSPHFESIRIVAYLRRQDDALLSMYGEYMRRGFSRQPFERFLDVALKDRGMVPYLYYKAMLSQWIAAFGREAISVRLFDRAALRGGEVLQDFMAEVLGAETDLSDLVPSAKDNVGLAAPVLEFLRVMHQVVPNRLPDGRFNPERAALRAAIDALPAEPRPRLSRAQSARIMERFAPANAWLGETFFPDVEGPLFPPRDDLPEEGNLGHVSLADFSSYLTRLTA